MADKEPRLDGAVPSRREIELHLEEILGSSAFKGSAKGKEFLRFVVSRCLDGDIGSLHERAIAIDLFGKDPAYEPSEDASVRVRANEVRKRLTGFYENEGTSAKVRIDLPAGGYVPQFRHSLAPAGETAEKPPQSVSSRIPRYALVLAASILLLGLTGLALYRMERPTDAPIESFWRPVFSDRNPVILCLPGLRALFPKGGSEIANALRAAPDSPGAVQDLTLHAGATDLFVQDDIVGMGPALGAIRITSHLMQKGKPVIARISQDVSFADLRSHPVVLMGGTLSSKWTEKMNQDVPFAFEVKDGVIGIVETREPRRSWFSPRLGHSKRSDEDYAIVGRILDSKSGQTILLAAGITTFGTQSAAECLTDNDCISKITAQAPRDWPSRNIEAVIHTKVLGNTPGPPQVVAARFW